MKTYHSDESKSIHWLKRQKYIESSDSLGDGSALCWQFFPKIPIDKIKHDPSKYPNQLDLAEVIYMMDNFYPSGFHPIRVDKDFNLKDGQHRLKFAKMVGLQFIDVWVEL